VSLRRLGPTLEKRGFGVGRLEELQDVACVEFSDAPLPLLLGNGALKSAKGATHPTALFFWDLRISNRRQIVDLKSRLPTEHFSERLHRPWPFHSFGSRRLRGHSDPGPQSFASSTSSLPFGREVFERFLNEFIDPGALFLRLVEVFHRAFNSGSPEQLFR